MSNEPGRRGPALAAWAVHCDALARGEQTFLLRAGAPDAGRPVGTRAWLLPRWRDQRPRDLTDPYRDRLEKLDALRQRDGRIRLQYVVSLEYRHTFDAPAPLLRLDGEHTLNARAVEELFQGTGSASLLVLRVHQSPRALVLEPDGTRAGKSGTRLPEWTDVGRRPAVDTEPVLSDADFLEAKARVLQRTGSIRAL